MAFTKRKTDNRKLNLQPNAMPAGLAFRVFYAGQLVVALIAEQGPKLSDNGNVTFTGGVSRGIVLPGDPTEALKLMTFEVEGITSKVAAAGVHSSGAGNPTVCHTVVFDIPVEDAEAKRTMGTIWATYSNVQGSIGASLQTRPVAAGIKRPAVRGTLVEANTGFYIPES